MNLRLKDLRKAKGMRQEDLAVAITSTPRIVGAWERGETALPLDDACTIADVLGCTLDELAGREWTDAGDTAAERQLVGFYRRMDDVDRDAFKSTAAALAYAGDAKKEAASIDARMVEVTEQAPFINP